DRAPAARREPSDELVVADALGECREVVRSPNDDALGRIVPDDAYVAGKEAGPSRAASETRLAHCSRDTLAQAPAQRRDNRRDDGGDLRIGEERNGRGHPVAGWARTSVQQRNEV